MDNQETDRKLREVFARNEPSFEKNQADRVTQAASSRHVPRSRTRGVLRLVTIAVAVLVVGGGAVAGVWQAVIHLRGDNPIILITDQTMSPGPTGASIPGLSKDEIEAVTFKNLAAGTSREATNEEIDRFIEYYSEADRYSDDVDTTPPAVIEIVLKSGATLSVWGGAERFQTVGLKDKQYTQHNIRGAELGHLLEMIATDTISPPLTAPATVSTEGAPTGSEQLERFRAVSDLAHHGYAEIEYKSPPSPDWGAELIVYGTVVKVDPARWSTPDGREPDPRSEADNPARIYTTFYIEPTEIKGTPRFGTPIAIMVPFHDKLLAPGDEVLVFAEYYEEWRSKYGAWKVDAYFSIEEVRGIYMKVGEQYLNLESGQPCQSQ